MSMQTLPVEVLYRILDLLNFKDIQFSFRFVCKRFSSIADNYPRMKIEFNYRTSNAEIRRLCRMVQPENIIKLSLQNSYFNSNVTKCFLSSIYLHQLTRLRSLILCDIDEYDFQTLMTPILMISTLTSVRIRMSGRKAWTDDHVGLLEPLISLPNIRHLTLDMTDQIINRITWSSPCALQKLTLQHCSYQQLCSIFERSPNLRTLVLNKSNLQDIDTTFRSMIFRSLTSLTLKNTQMSIDDLEFFLSLHPCLVSLELSTKSLCSWEFFQRFSQWEHFLCQTLPHLDKFKFYVCTNISNFQHIESILSPFCTPFWLRKKRWFVTCEYTNHGRSKTLALYSSTYRNTLFPDNLNFGKMTYIITTTSCDTQLNGSNMWSGRFSLLQMMGTIAKHEVELLAHDASHNMARLAIEIDRQWSINVIEHLSTLIDLSRIQELWLLEKYTDGLEPDRIESLLRKTPNIRTLGLSLNHDVKSRIFDLASIVSHRIDHLKLYVTDVKCMKLILKYVQGISTITFEQRDHDSAPCLDMIEWLARKRRRFFVYNNHKCVQTWFDKDAHELSTRRRGHKRKRST